MVKRTLDIASLGSQLAVMEHGLEDKSNKQEVKEMNSLLVKSSLILLSNVVIVNYYNNY
jgi:hypothetical protein